MTGTTAPLVDRDLEDAIACVSGQPSSFQQTLPVNSTIRVKHFLAHVQQLATKLPEAPYLINLCDNRYVFMVAFCAAILRRQTNLLPPNKTTATQATLVEKYPGAYVLHDGVEICEGLTEFNLSQVKPFTVDDTSDQVPQVELEFLSAITFTSGSTGDSKPNLKPWLTFVESTQINAKYMLDASQRVFNALATVPGQHMWGMETSILLPLMKPVCISDARPLFPQDILKLLNAMPEPRMLVSTPVHLRALSMSGIDFPDVERILCATAPLSQSMAKSTESIFNGQVQEVYGCSEVGSMSYRRTATTDVWTIFEGLNFTPSEAKHIASADHLPLSIELHDRMEKIDDRRFRLLGRNDDMIEIAGKRGSLQEMNALLQSIPGLKDGAIFLPEKTGNVVRPVALVVLEANVDKHEIAEYFRSRLDPVFVPRPIYVVDALPREENGKLPKAKLLSLLKSLQK